MVNLCELKAEPVIEYPLIWEYKVIFELDVDAKSVVSEILRRDFNIEKSHLSKGGKYQSYKLSVMVSDKKDRLELFEKLRQKAKFVL